MFGYFPQYCERMLGGFGHEPLNVLSSLAFVLAAVRLGHTPVWREGGREERLLVALLAVIGLGSVLWHAVARPWALWADVLPIGVFMVGYLAFFLRRVAGLRARGVLAGLAGFAAVETGLLPILSVEFLSGAVLYLPAALALLFMAGYLLRHRWPAWRAFAAAALCLALAIAARVMDLPLCMLIPFGTHFLWHLFAALALYFLMRGGFNARRQAARAKPLP